MTAEERGREAAEMWGRAFSTEGTGQGARGLSGSTGKRGPGGREVGWGAGGRPHGPRKG